MTRLEARLQSALFDVVFQACAQPDGVLDSYALTAYAQALRLLGELGVVRIQSDVGRRVLAVPVERETPQ